MRSWMKVAGSVILAGALTFGVLSVSEWGGQTVNAAAENSQYHTVSVSGNGELLVKPDISYITVSVETDAATAKEAQAQNAAKMAKVNTLLKDKWKIDAKDIKTGQFYVQPNYTYTEKEGQKVKGYKAYHSLTVNYRDLDKIGQLLDEITAAGANRIDSVRFSTENPDQYQEQVIQKAMEHAELKAKAIAKASKREIGRVLSVVQSDGDYNTKYNVSFAVAESVRMDSSSTSIEPGEITIRTTLAVVFELK